MAIGSVAVVPATFVHQHRVRYRDCDAQGVVFNANYLAFLDDAFVELFRAALGSPAGMVSAGVDTMVVDAHISWRSPARYDDVLDISLEGARFGRTSQTTRFVFRVGERIVATGEIVHVYVGHDQTKIPVPDDVRAAIARVIHVDAD